MSDQNRWPNLENLQAFLDWQKNISEAQLRTWLVDAYVKGEISPQADMLRGFLMTKSGIRISVINTTTQNIMPSTPQPKPDAVEYVRPK